MKRLAILTLASCCLSLASCGIIDGVMQPAKRLIQSGVRTLSDAGEPGPPATLEASRPFSIATKAAN